MQNKMTRTKIKLI